MHNKFVCIFASTRGSRLVNWLVIEAKREATASLFVFLDFSTLFRADNKPQSQPYNFP